MVVVQEVVDGLCDGVCFGEGSGKVKDRHW